MSMVMKSEEGEERRGTTTFDPPERSHWCLQGSIRTITKIIEILIGISKNTKKSNRNEEFRYIKKC